MEVKIAGIEVINGIIRVWISHDNARSWAFLLFEKLPKEIAEEYFRTATKEQMDKLRGSP